MNTHVTTNSFSPRRPWLAKGAAALLAAAIAATTAGPAHAGVFISVNFAPPPLPVYVQPPIPGPGYIWTPGYWAWDGAEYYWVPGTWVLAPYVGALWTPGYWGWNGGLYIFHAGYWGPHVGFYGGINYGYGYGGYGYDGGYWNHGGFYYNRSVNHITNNITNVYNRTVINNTINRISFNGGPRGIATHATLQQMAWAREPHTAPVAAQVEQREMASRMPSMRAAVNHGMPPIAATPRAGMFSGGDRAMPVAARAARHTPPGNGALRSAAYAPHANAAYRPAGENRYWPATYGNRLSPYQPQSYQPRAYHAAPQAYRPAQATYRPERYQYQPEQRHAGHVYPSEQNYSESTYQPGQRYTQPAYRVEQRYAEPAHGPSYRTAPRPTRYAHAAARGGGRDTYGEHRDQH